MRNRTGTQRPRNADENALGRHVRQPSGIALAGASKIVTGHVVKNGVQRPVLTEVTTAAVNRLSKVRPIRWFAVPLPPSVILHNLVVVGSNGGTEVQ